MEFLENLESLLRKKLNEEIDRLKLEDTYSKGSTISITVNPELCDTDPEKFEDAICIIQAVWEEASRDLRVYPLTQEIEESPRFEWGDPVFDSSDGMTTVTLSFKGEGFVGELDEKQVLEGLRTLSLDDRVQSLFQMVNQFFNWGFVPEGDFKQINLDSEATKSIANKVADFFEVNRATEDRENNEEESATEQNLKVDTEDGWKKLAQEFPYKSEAEKAASFVLQLVLNEVDAKIEAIESTLVVP